MAEKVRRLLIEGRVQAVSYRAWTREEALARNLKGFVRNLSDGRVEAVIAGPAAVVDDMIEACRSGPAAARVWDIDVSDWADEIPAGFEIRQTR